MKHESHQDNDNNGNIAWRSLAGCYKAVYAHVNSDLRRHGLTPPQYGVIRAVARSTEKALTMGEISKELLVTAADVTSIVDNLEDSNFVRRLRQTTRDRRVAKVKMTADGLRLFTRVSAAHKKRISQLMGVLSRSELYSLIRYTTKIRLRLAEKEHRSDAQPLDTLLKA